MYITRAIILSRIYIRDKKVRIILFTEDYGKITAWEKKSHSIYDIGTIVEARIERKSIENHIERVAPLHTPDTRSWNYQTIIEYLKLLALIKDILPYGTEQRDIFSDLYDLTRYISQSGYTEVIDSEISEFQLFILIQNRILKLLGILDEKYYNTSLLRAIYSRIDTVSMKSIFLSKSLSTDIEEILKLSILKSAHPYIH